MVIAKYSIGEDLFLSKVLKTVFRFCMAGKYELTNTGRQHIH